LAVLACAAGNAQAIESCSVSADALNFGAYASPNGVAIDTVHSTITVTCSPTPLLGLLGIIVGCQNDTYSVQLSTGNAGTYAPRSLSSGGAMLSYNLYTDAGRTLVWGDGIGATQTVTGNLSGVLLALGACPPTPIQHPVYGRIPGSQNVPAGSYSDTITVTVTFD
jgi:spore coat protein U-like protein